MAGRGGCSKASAGIRERHTAPVIMLWGPRPSPVRARVHRIAVPRCHSKSARRPQPPAEPSTAARRAWPPVPVPFGAMYGMHRARMAERHCHRLVNLLKYPLHRCTLCHTLHTRAIPCSPLTPLGAASAPPFPRRGVSCIFCACSQSAPCPPRLWLRAWRCRSHCPHEAAPHFHPLCPCCCRDSSPLAWFSGTVRGPGDCVRRRHPRPHAMPRALPVYQCARSCLADAPPLPHAQELIAGLPAADPALQAQAGAGCGAPSCACAASCVVASNKSVLGYPFCHFLCTVCFHSVDYAASMPVPRTPAWCCQTLCLHLL